LSLSSLAAVEILITLLHSESVWGQRLKVCIPLPFLAWKNAGEYFSLSPSSKEKQWDLAAELTYCRLQGCSCLYLKKGLPFTCIAPRYAGLDEESVLLGTVSTRLSSHRWHGGRQ